MTDTSEYAVWEALLAAKASGQTPPPIDPNTPAVGFYRTRRKGQPYVPVAIWLDGGLCCQIDGQDVSAQELIKAWPWISKNPVTWNQYEFYKNNGRWEDADETVHEQMAENPKAVIGDNEPPDEFTTLSEQIEAAKTGLSAYEKIEDATTAAKGQSLRSRLLELSAEADKQKDAEADPPYRIYKAALAKWKPLIDSAKSGADAIRVELKRFETKRADDARKAQEEIANKARAAAAEAAKIGQIAPPPPVPSAPIAPLAIRGAYGRAASVKPVKVVKKITDIDACFKFLRDCPEILECLTKIAKSYAKNYPETDIPGVETAMEMDVK